MVGTFCAICTVTGNPCSLNKTCHFSSVRLYSELFEHKNKQDCSYQDDALETLTALYSVNGSVAFNSKSYKTFKKKSSFVFFYILPSYANWSIGYDFRI